MGTLVCAHAPPRVAINSAAAGAAIRKLLERNIRPSDILTRKAFENAMVTVMALGGTLTESVAGR